MALFWLARRGRVGGSVGFSGWTSRGFSSIPADGLDGFPEHLLAAPPCVGAGRQQVGQGQSQQHRDQCQYDEPESGEQQVRPARGPGVDARADQCQDRDGHQDSHAQPRRRSWCQKWRWSAGDRSVSRAFRSYHSRSPRNNAIRQRPAARPKLAEGMSSARGIGSSPVTQGRSLETPGAALRA